MKNLLSPSVPRHCYVLNFPFVIALILLLTNDLFLKYEYGNWLTGKLSDFSGILLLPLFLKFIFPRTKWLPITATIALFTFWKLPVSNFFIASINKILPFTWYRVVDYTDFIAFAMLPVAHYIYQYISWYVIKIPSLQMAKLASGLLFMVCSWSFLATSIDEYDIITDGSIDGCCSTGVVIDSLGGGVVFIPDIFTPNSDGLNDVFQVEADSNIARVDSFRVFTIPDDSLVFAASYNLSDANNSNGFTGLVNDTIIPQQYRYEINLTALNGETRFYNGYVCCLPCNAPLNQPAFGTLEYCGFATKFNSETGLYDYTNPSYETLECFDEE